MNIMKKDDKQKRSGEGAFEPRQKVDTEEGRKKFLIDEIHKMRDLKKSIKSHHTGATA